MSYFINYNNKKLLQVVTECDGRGLWHVLAPEDVVVAVVVVAVVMLCVAGS